MHTASSRQVTVPPVGIKKITQDRLPAVEALTAIGEPWFSDEHQADLLAVALVVRELAPAGSLQAQCAAELRRLCVQRITMGDKLAIALNLAACLPWLQMQPDSHVELALISLAAQSLSLAA